MTFEITGVDLPSAQGIFEILAAMQPLASGRDLYSLKQKIETVCTSVIIWQAWTWSALKPAVGSERAVGNSELVA